MGSETADLIAHVEAEGGMCYICELPDGDDFIRAAVFTVSPIEATNLNRFGDVFFFGGTAIRNAMGWTTVPVTLVDGPKEIVSGGLLFTAFEREEMYLWFLQTLQGILVDHLRTIFTDEDSALLPAIPICEWSIQGLHMGYVSSMDAEISRLEFAHSPERLPFPLKR
jgi:hypothetical protein